MSRRRQPAQFDHGRGRHAAAGGVLCHPVAEFRGAVPGEEQVEPAEDRAVLVDEHVVGVDAGLLLGQHRTVLLGELVEELIAAVGDEGGEVAAVGPLESQDRRGVVGVQSLQLGHAADSTQPPRPWRACRTGWRPSWCCLAVRKFSVIADNFELIIYVEGPAGVSDFPSAGSSDPM
ncbi:MAG TPA: hypothetical protein VF223_23065 [Trebonia sp.]